MTGSLRRWRRRSLSLHARLAHKVLHSLLHPLHLVDDGLSQEIVQVHLCVSLSQSWSLVPTISYTMEKIRLISLTSIQVLHSLLHTLQLVEDELSKGVQSQEIVQVHSCVSWFPSWSLVSTIPYYGEDLIVLSLLPACKCFTACCTHPTAAGWWWALPRIIARPPLQTKLNLGNIHAPTQPPISFSSMQAQT